MEWDDETATFTLRNGRRLLSGPREAIGSTLREYGPVFALRPMERREPFSAEERLEIAAYMGAEWHTLASVSENEDGTITLKMNRWEWDGVELVWQVFGIKPESVVALGPCWQDETGKLCWQE
jgi:hypothetical protein